MSAFGGLHCKASHADHQEQDRNNNSCVHLRPNNLAAHRYSPVFSMAGSLGGIQDGLRDGDHSNVVWLDALVKGDPPESGVFLSKSHSAATIPETL
jgi:hypothetical protein